MNVKEFGVILSLAATPRWRYFSVALIDGFLSKAGALALAFRPDDHFRLSGFWCGFSTWLTCGSSAASGARFPPLFPRQFGASVNFEVRHNDSDHLATHDPESPESIRGGFPCIR